MIYTIFVSIGAFFHSIKENKENEKGKSLYRHPDGLTYTDTKGRSRLLTNNEIVFYTHNKNGDYILVDVSGHVYKKFSEDERVQKINERKEIAIKNNETTYCIDDNNHRNDWICQGKRFKDFTTGDIYIIRYINYKYYYMNASNGMLVRKTDWQIKHDDLNKDKNTYLNNDLNIEEFNEKQKNIQEKRMLFRNFDYNYFCDIYK